MEKLRIITIACILLIQILSNSNVDCGIPAQPAEITNGTLAFFNEQLVINLFLNISIFPFEINLNGISLSNSVSFNSPCTFLNLTLDLSFEDLPTSQYNLTVSFADSEDIIRFIGNNPESTCLVDINSTFLQLPTNFNIPPLQQTIYPLDVIPDTTPPFYIVNSTIIDLRLGFINSTFSELIVLDSFDISLLGLSPSNQPNTSEILLLSTLAYTQAMTGVNRTYSIKLEVFELPYVGEFCNASCYLHIGIGDLASDVFGNPITSDGVVVSAVLINYEPELFHGTFSTTPYTATQLLVSIFPPSERVEDVIGYHIYLFPLLVSYYNGNCDYNRAFQFQKEQNVTQWNAENPVNSGSFPPCLNTSDYRCHFSNGENVTIDIFPGYDFANVLITLYPQIMFNDTSDFFLANEYYSDILDIKIFTDDPKGQQDPGNETNVPLPSGNQVLVTWNVEPSFCDQHQLTIKYAAQQLKEFERGLGPGPITTGFNSYVSLDRQTTCVDQYVYIYANSYTIILVPEIRINSPQIHIPEGSCTYVELFSFNPFIPFFPNGLDRPVITSAEDVSNNISLTWIGFEPETGFVIDFYNIYSFPIYALKYNGGSCSNVNSLTSSREFTFQPTEYYIHSVRLPQDDFPFTCPPQEGINTPYQCYSELYVPMSLSFSYEATYAQGIIVEAVARHNVTNQVKRIGSFPFIFNTFSEFGSSGRSPFLEIFWNTQRCQTETSFIFFHYLIPEFNEISPLQELNSIISPCSDGKLVNTETLEPNYIYYLNYMSEVSTSSGVECLLSYESNERFSFLPPPGFPQSVRFEYLDYKSIRISIFNGQNFSLPATIYTIPFETLRIRPFGIDMELCPSGTQDLPLHELILTSNYSIVDMANNLTCETSSDYFCTSVSNTENIVLPIIPGFSTFIRVEFGGSQQNSFNILPGKSIVFSQFDPQFFIDIGEENSQSVLVSVNNIKLDWNVGFFCAPGSYFYIGAVGYPLINEGPPRRRRRGLQLPEIISPPMSCDIGTYTLENLDFDTDYQVSGNVFSNSTTNFFQTCTVINFFFPPIVTPPLLVDIKVIDFSTIQVFWNPIQQVTSYTLLAYPSNARTIIQSIGNTFSESNFTEDYINAGSYENPPQFFQLCLDSSPDLNCSKATSTELNAVISVIPGYEYELAIAYELMGVMQITMLSRPYIPEYELGQFVFASGFDSALLYYYRSTLCTPDARTVYYYEGSGNLQFPVNNCTDSEHSIDAIEFLSYELVPRVTFIFPFIDVIAPGRNITSPPANLAVIIYVPLFFLPISASPMITNVTPPVDSTSDVYQVYWNLPGANLPNSHEFETFVLYAFPKEGNETQTILLDFPCSSNFTEDEIFESQPLGVNYAQIQCPPPPDETYFCREYSTYSGDIQLFTLLEYDLLVEARYIGGLRVYHIDYIIPISAAQDVSVVGVTLEPTPNSIIITWNSLISFCSSVSFGFIIDEEPLINTVQCSAGSYEIGSLAPTTTYDFIYLPQFNVSDIQPGTERCIINLPDSDPTIQINTTSFCTPINPCGSVGLCSEGFQNSSFHCDCDIGYTFDGSTCVDINECSVMPNICMNGDCLNNMGSFTCTCFQGYFAISDIICFDINECGTPSNCVNGICTNLISPENYRCDCTAEFEGFSCTIPVGTPTCPSISELTTLSSTNNVTFPVTEYGVVSIVLCSQLNTTLFGNITRQCLDTGEWGPIDLGNCLRNIFVVAEVLTSESEIRILTPEESVMLTETLATATQESMGFLFPAEISVAAVGVGAVTESLADLSGDELSDNLDIVQASLVEITSNVLRTENSAAFASTTPSEAQTNVNNLVDGIQNLAILIARVAEENTTLVLEILEPNVALILAVERGRTESLVLGSNLTMPVGNNTSAVMAAQTSITIPASIFPSNESIAVSVALFPTIQELASDVFVNDSSEPEGNLEDLLVTAIASINLIRTDGTPITELENDISIAFVINSPELQESEIVSEIRCASTRVLAEGWNFNYVSLINGDDVPTLPAICNASHLTHFGVLVSVRSLPLTDAEKLALEILTYLTCGLSIIALIFSIVAYLIVWWKTRNKQEGPFKKDATILHLNFAVALLLALTFFLLSDAAYSNEGACKAFTIIQYYFWLSVFTSSLSIGIYLLIKIFAWSSQRRFWFYLVLLSWALPLPLIIITPAAARDSLINTSEEVCFFSKEPSYSNLAFIVPMLVITITNLVILIITAIVLFRISKGNKSIFPQIRGVLIASFILAPILGLPWLFSIIATAPTSAVAFIFTIILGLQGVLFAILYPLRTKEVIDYVLRCKSPTSTAIDKMVSTSTAGTSSRNPPSALKFKIKRADNSGISKSTSVTKSKTENLPSSDFNSPDIHMEAPRSPKVRIQTEDKAPSPEPHYRASFPEDTVPGTKSVSPPPYGQLGDESETRL